MPQAFCSYCFNRRLNNIKEARQVFTRAYNVATTLDWPERVVDAWLMLERESGDIATYKDALTKTRTIMKNVEALRAQVSLGLVRNRIHPRDYFSKRY